VAAKVVLREAPLGLVRLAFPGFEVRSVTPDETELQALERRMDKLFELTLEGEKESTWVHIEVEATWASDVPQKTFWRWSLAHQARASVRSLVFVLRPGDKQGAPTNVHEVTVLGRHVVTFHFDVVCLWSLEASAVLAQRDPGVLPLVPFTNGASHGAIDEAHRLLETVEPKQRRIDLQVALAVFSGTVFPEVRWLARMREEDLMDSPVYEEILKRGEARGEARGEVRGRHKLLADQIRRRLGSNPEVTALVESLAKCDVPTLDEIGLLVLETPRESLAATIERRVNMQV